MPESGRSRKLSSLVGIEATRPLCGIQRGENRKSQRAEGDYAGFTDSGQSPDVPSLQRRDRRGNCRFVGLHHFKRAGEQIVQLPAEHFRALRDDLTGTARRKSL